MKNIILYIMLIFSQTFSVTNVDSLLQVWDVSAVDDKIRVLDEICEQTFYTNSQLCVNYSSRLDSLFNEISDTLNYLPQKANIRYNSAKAFYYLGDLDKAYNNSMDAHKIYSFFADSSSILQNFNLLGNILVAQDMLQEAMEKYDQAMDIAQALDDRIYIGKINNNIAIIYRKLGMFDKSIEFYNLALDIYKTLNMENLVAVAIHNLGNSYGEKGDSLTAVSYLKQASIHAEKVGDKYLLCSSETNLASGLSLMGNQEDALKSPNKALRLAKELNSKNLISINFNTLGEISFRLKHWNDAKYYFEKSLEIATAANFVEHELKAYLNLAGTYEELGDIPKSYKYFKLYMQIKNKSINNKTAQEIANIQKRFDLKQSQIKIQKLEQKQQLDKIELASERKTRRVLTMFLFGIAVLFLFILALYRKLHLQHILLTQKNRELKHAMDEIKTLNELLPICSHCKKIRDDEGYWQDLEAYFETHTDSKFSHGICQSCMDEHYPEISARIRKNRN